MIETKQILLLGVALVIGIIIGIERGFHSREVEDGERVAGLRTYALIGLLGGCAGLLSSYLGASILGFSFVGFSGVVAAGFLWMRRQQKDIGITSLIAALLTFILGAMALVVHFSIPASIAVVVALILRVKPYLHHWLRNLQQEELHAVFQLLLISVVLLSLLPNQGYGPWAFFNPFKIWWMVVTVTIISFSGYFAMKIAGPKKGILLTALFAGMVHSTIVTYNFSRLTRKQVQMRKLLAAGVLVACSIMYPRILLLATIINPKMFMPLSLPMLAMMVVTALPALFMTGGAMRRSYQEATSLPNPMEIKPAIAFGALLTVVMFLTKAVKEYSGDLGIYILSLVSGFVDVDAINLSLSQMSIDDLSIKIAVVGVIIAASANNLFKSALVIGLGKPKLSLMTWVCFPLLLAAAAGFLVAWLSFTSLPFEPLAPFAVNP